MNRWTRRSAATPRSVLTALVVVGGLALAGCAAGQRAQTAEQLPTVDGANVVLGPLALRDVTLQYPEGGIYRPGSDARLEMVLANDSGQSDALIEVRTDAAQDVRIFEAVTGGTGSSTPTPAGTSAEPSSTPTGTSSGTPTGTSEPETPSASAGTGEPSDDPSSEPSSSESPVPSPAATGAAGATPSAGTSTLTQVPVPPNGLVQFREDGPTIQLVGLTRQLRPAQQLEVTFVFENAGQITVQLPVGDPRGELPLAPTVTSEEDSNEG